MADLYNSGSEFDSEAEDIECRLYAQLYFGDVNNKEPTVEKATSNLVEFSSTVSTSVTHLENSNTNIDAIDKSRVNELKDITANKISLLTSDKSENLDKRKRNLSICSIDSISGKEPLDNLYCHYDDFEESLIQKTTLDTISELNSFQDDESSHSDKESKYSMLSKAVNKHGKKSLTAEFDSCSSSEEEICVLPPVEPKNVETLTLDTSTTSSSSDSEESIQVINEIKKDNLKRKLVSRLETNRKRNAQGSSCIVSCDISSTTDSTDDSECEFLKVTSSPMTPLTINVRKDKYTSSTTFSQESCNNQEKERPCFRKSQVIFSKNRPFTKRKPSCINWSIEMASFYDSDISDEFDVEEIHNTQSDDSNKWIISAEDKYATPRNRYFNKQVRCFRCKEYGHNTNQCSRVPHCLYCGSSKHVQLNHCPDLCCLKCGGNVHGYKGDCPLTFFRMICKNCGQSGHHQSLCPDLWRCFHSTTKGSIPVRPCKKKAKRSIRRNAYCYNCAKKGHFGVQCSNKNYKKYSFVTTLAINYDSTKLNFENKENYATETMKVNLSKAAHFFHKRNLVLTEIMAMCGVSVLLQQKTKINWKVKFGGKSSQLREAKYMIEALTKKGRERGYGYFINKINALATSKIADIDELEMTNLQPLIPGNIMESDNLKLGYSNIGFETPSKLLRNSSKKLKKKEIELNGSNLVSSSKKLINKTLEPIESPMETELQPIVSASKKLKKKSLGLNDCKSEAALKPKISKTKKLKKNKSLEINDSYLETVLQPIKTTTKNSKKKTLESSNNTYLESEFTPTISNSKKYKKSLITKLNPTASESKKLKKTAFISKYNNLLTELEPSVSTTKKLRKKTLGISNNNSSLVTAQTPDSVAKKLRKKTLELSNNNSSLVADHPPDSVAKKLRKKTLGLSDNSILVADQPPTSVGKKLKKITSGFSDNIILDTDQPSDYASKKLKKRTLFSTNDSLVIELGSSDSEPSKIKKSSLKLNGNIEADLELSASKSPTKKSLLQNDCNLCTEKQPTILLSKSNLKKLKRRVRKKKSSLENFYQDGNPPWWASLINYKFSST